MKIDVTVRFSDMKKKKRSLISGMKVLRMWILVIPLGSQPQNLPPVPL